MCNEASKRIMRLYRIVQAFQHLGNKPLVALDAAKEIENADLAACEQVLLRIAKHAREFANGLNDDSRAQHDLLRLADQIRIEIAGS